MDHTYEVEMINGIDDMDAFKSLHSLEMITQEESMAYRVSLLTVKPFHTLVRAKCYLFIQSSRITIPSEVNVRETC